MKQRINSFGIALLMLFWLCVPVIAADENSEDTLMSPPKEILSHTEKGTRGDIVTKVIQERRGSEFIIKVQVVKDGILTETIHRFDTPNFRLEVPITERIVPTADPTKYPDAKIANFTQKLDRARDSMLKTDYVTALKFVNEALLVDDSNPQAHMMKGSIYYAMGKYDMANEEYDLVLKVDPNNTEVLQFKKYMEEKSSQREKIDVEPR